MTKRLKAVNMRLADHKRKNFAIEIDAGTTFKEILDPDFYSSVAAKLHQYDVLEAIAKDNSFWAMLLVEKIQGTSVVVREIKHIDFTKSAEGAKLAAEVKAAYKVKHMGENNWCVLRNGEKGDELVIEGLHSKKDAEKAKTKHIAEIAA